VRASSRLAAALLATLVASLLVPASSFAAAGGHSLLSSFGASGSGDGQFSSPHGVAYDQAHDFVYLADTGNNRLEKFGPSGNFLAAWGWGVDDGSAEYQVCTSGCQAGIAGEGEGQFSEPRGVAVDGSAGPSSGDVYVSDNHHVLKFSSSGAFIGNFVESFQTPSGGGVATDNSGNVWTLDDGTDHVVEYEQNGAAAGFEFNTTYGTSTSISVNGPGTRVYTTRGSGDLDSWDTSGSPPVYGVNSFTLTFGVSSSAVDPVTGDVYANQGTVQQFTPSGTPIGPSFGSGEVGGVAIRGSNAYAYLSNQFSNTVSIFQPIIIPDVTTNPADPADVGHEDATLRGHVDPAGGGNITECYVEYGESIPYSNTKPCEGVPLPITSATDVHVHLTGLTTGTTYHYRFVAANTAGTNYGADQTAVPAYVLGVTTEPATGVTNSTATLNGSFEMDSAHTQWYFEYGLGTSYGTNVPASPVDAGSTLGTVVATEDVTGLVSGATYHYRLVATSTTGSFIGTSYGPDQTFTTQQAPTISSATAVNVTATSADLIARVNPRGSDTGVRFEYGTTIAYGSIAPEKDIGAGMSDVPVTVHLSNLQSGATYHFRVVAENEWGTAASDDQTFAFFTENCPNAHVRQQTGTAYLPDCRAYELVVPPEIGAVQLLVGEGQYGGAELLGEKWYLEPSQNTGAATSPSRFAFWAGIGQLPGANTPNVLQDLYVSTRTSEGWVTHFPGVSGSEALASGGTQCNLSMDRCINYHTECVVGCIFPDPGSNAPYIFDTGQDSGKAGRMPSTVGEVPEGELFNGDGKPSADFSHFAFSSNNIAFAPEGLTSAPGSAYDNHVAEKETVLISKLSGGAPIPQDGGDSSEFIRIPAVSTDGSHILMSTIASGGGVHLYMSINDGPATQIGPAGPGHGVEFVGMTPDGSKIYFTSAEKLTGDDTDNSTDLFMWSEDAPGSLTRVSAGSGGSGDTDACSVSWTTECSAVSVSTGIDHSPTAAEFGGKQFQYVPDNPLAANGDIYFYSPEQLDGSDKGLPNKRNLYVYRNGHAQFVATFEDGTLVNRIDVSPDDSHMALVTKSQLTSYDNAGRREMYSYNPATGQLVCVSCIPTGEPPTSDAFAAENGLFMSNDGRTFFSTRDALVPFDTDGVRDVYEYVNGRPQLISSGTASIDTWGGSNLLQIYPPATVGLEGVSADGTDVYFSTFDTLVSQDHNGNVIKFYDARTGGGFPANPPPPPCKAADECHGAGSTPPPSPLIGTGAQLGKTGNLQKKCKKGFVKKHGKCVRKGKKHKRHKKHGAHHG
jgi:hypothetical protein